MAEPIRHVEKVVGTDGLRELTSLASTVNDGRETDRQTDRQTDRHTETGTQAGRQADRQTDKNRSRDSSTGERTEN